MNLTDGQKWFILLVLGGCFLFFFITFVVQSFSMDGGTYKTPEEVRATAYHDCISQAEFFYDEAEIKAISQCEALYGGRN